MKDRKIVDYFVQEESSVKQFLEKGYELYGDPIAHPQPNVQFPAFFQALVKYED